MMLALPITKSKQRKYCTAIRRIAFPRIGGLRPSKRDTSPKNSTNHPTWELGVRLVCDPPALLLSFALSLFLHFALYSLFNISPGPGPKYMPKATAMQLARKKPPEYSFGDKNRDRDQFLTTQIKNGFEYHFEEPTQEEVMNFYLFFFFFCVCGFV